MAAPIEVAGEVMDMLTALWIAIVVCFIIIAGFLIAVIYGGDGQ